MMDELFEQDELTFWPVSGTFDVVAIGKQIETIGFSFRDPADAAMFVICPDEAYRQRYIQERKDFPKSGYPMMLLIRVEPNRIYLNQFAGPEFYTYSRQFISWLKDNYSVRVTGELDKDLTEFLTSVV